MVDMAHVAGLVILLASIKLQFPAMLISLLQQHKTLRGPRGGLILTMTKNLLRKSTQPFFPGNSRWSIRSMLFFAKAVSFKVLDPLLSKDYAQK